LLPVKSAKFQASARPGCQIVLKRSWSQPQKAAREEADVL
jgi:hypothetical protein